MLALGSVHEVIERQIEEGNVDFDIKGFLENVVLNDAANPGKLLSCCQYILRKLFKSGFSKTTLTRLGKWVLGEIYKNFSS